MAREKIDFLHQKACHDHPPARNEPYHAQLHLELKRTVIIVAVKIAAAISNFNQGCAGIKAKIVLVIRRINPVFQQGHASVSIVGSRGCMDG
eukprot:14507852-Ditylum_brightwellii.AAC.1